MPSSNPAWLASSVNLRLYQLLEYAHILLENYYSGGGVVGELENKTKLKPSSVWLELELSLAIFNVNFRIA